MIHAPCSVDVSVTNGATTPRRLVINLAADTGPAGYRLRGTIELDGLDAWRIEAIQAALARTLGGRATLMLGPADLANLLDGQNVEVPARRIAREYDLTPAELAAKAGIACDTANSLLTEERHRNRPVVEAITALTIRLADAPTPGEMLRRQRGGRHGNARRRANVATQIGVDEATLRRWEDDEALVPFDLADAVRNALGLPPGSIAVAPPVDQISLPASVPDIDPAEIKLGRIARGLGQAGLARRIPGATQPRIADWEHGRSRPTPDQANALRQILDLGAA